MAFKGKFPVAPRDFSLVCSSRKEKDGSYLQVLRSIHHEDIPEMNGFVRAKLFASGFIIRPIRVPETKQMISSVTYILQFDPKGWLPTFIANKLTEYHPLTIARIRSFVPTHQDNPIEKNVYDFQNEKLEKSYDTTNERRARMQEVIEFPNEEDSSEVIQPARGQLRYEIFDDTEEEDGEDEEDDSENYTDTSSDLTNLNISNQDQFNACLSNVQREISQLQETIERYQRRVRAFEQNFSNFERSTKAMIANQRGENDSKFGNLRKDYSDKLHTITEQIIQTNHQVKRKEEEWDSKINEISFKIQQVEKSSSRILLPFNSWTGGILFFLFLLLWPVCSYKFLDLLRIWWRRTHRGHLISALLSLGGWIVFLKRLTKKSLKIGAGY